MKYEQSRLWVAVVRSAIAAIAVLAFSVTLLRADEPAISSLSPAGFQRGREVELTIGGARIGDVGKLLLYDRGVEVLSLTSEADNKVTAKLKIGEDCPPGLHAIRLSTKTGISNMRYFGVSPLPQVEEVEPNDIFAEPQKLEMNSTLSGLCRTEDVDYYSVELAAGQRLTVELEGLRLGTDFFDPFVAILDENRFELARSDDAPLLQQDCLCSFTAEAAGRYIIEVRESSFGGNDRAHYRLHVGDFPRPVAIVPAGGRPGETIEARITDVSGESWTDSITLPAEEGEFDYFAMRDGKLAPSPNKLRVVDLPNYVATEPDTDHAALTAVEVPAAFNGVLESEGDVDWFKINGKKDQTLDYTVYGRRVLRSPIDSWLEIHKATGGQLAANDDAGGPDSRLSFKFPEDGQYLIAIRDQLSEGSRAHAYRIEVAAPRASLALTIDELRRYESQVIEVPQGAHMAVLLRAGRSNFGGDLGLRLENGPAGLELLTPTIAASESFIPMLIRASADAQPDAALADLIAETLPDGAGVRGTLSQRTMLIRGQNNVDVWGHDTKKLAVSVTEALPFTIDVEQPRVPLVRSGNTNYVVRVKRNEGFNEAIALQVLYNPGGCSASGSVSIPGDQSEALIPLTANENAAIGKFPIAILARAKARNGGVWVSTPFINLDVADSFFGFNFPKTVAETGKSSVVNVGLTVKLPPEGEAQFELLGLPAGVTSPNPIVKLTEGLESLSFPIEVAADARVGQFKSLVVRATITRPDGTIVQTQGTGELQTAAPLATAPAIAAATPAPAAAPSAKPLSRLEQLRQAKGLLKD